MANISAESIAQIQVIEWVKQKTDIPFIHIPNQGKRNWMTANILKRMGMIAGVPDLFFPRAARGYPGLWIELKVAAGKVSPRQALVIKLLNDEGYFALPVWGADAAITVIKHHFSVPD